MGTVPRARSPNASRWERARATRSRSAALSAARCPWAEGLASSSLRLHSRRFDHHPPDELRAIHFALDPIASEQLEEEWRRLGLSNFPLDIQECEDRRLTRAALELAA